MSFWDFCRREDRLDRLRARFERGQNYALLAAVYFCAKEQLVMPDWVAQNFAQRFEHVRNCEVRSWDEAFGKPFRKKLHLENRRRDRELRPKIWDHIEHIRTTELTSQCVATKCSGDGTVARAAREAQRRYRDPPDLSGGQAD